MNTLKIVAFKLGEEEYGLDIDHVQSIERINHITRVPNTPDYVRGVINLRGNVSPIIDLRKRIHHGETQYTEHTRIVITKYEEIELGLIVDKTSDVIDVLQEDIQPVTNGVLHSDYFTGVAKLNGRLIILLDLERIMMETTN